MAKEEKPVDDIVEEKPFEVESQQPEINEAPSKEGVENFSHESKAEPKSPNVFQRFLKAYKSKKKISIPLTVLVVLGVIAAVPVTRYALAGLVIKKDIEVEAVDSKSGAYLGLLVILDGKKQTNESQYPPTFHKVPVGKHHLRIESGDYYKVIDQTIEVKMGRAKKVAITMPMEATGRSLTFIITNKISGKPVSALKMKSGTSESITDGSGQATIVVNPDLDVAEVEISGEGYNTLKFKHKVIADPVENFEKQQIVPSGKVYFLSKQSGKIDVVKTDLDGSNRQTVLAGTGSEEDTNTVLLASRDWKYLALLSRRDAKAKLYVIDTSSDKVTEIDSGDATFTPVGWQDHYFAYKVFRDNVPAWQGKNAALKTYNAEDQKLNVIDETTAEGTSNNDYAGDAIESVYIQKDSLIYVKRWSANYYSVYRLAGKHMGIYSAKLNGSAKQTLKDFDAGNNAYINATAAKPDEIYYGVYGADTTYYEYADGKLTEAKDINADSFNKPYPTYLLSPGGQATFWYEPRDGKNTLFVGTVDGGAGKEIATLSEYITYGWYSDNYLLVSKKGSELYILPASGVGDKGQVLKISDYHKPDASFYGYGGGYGGL